MKNISNEVMEIITVIQHYIKKIETRDNIIFKEELYYNKFLDLIQGVYNIFCTSE